MLIKNGKFFVKAEDTDEDIKELFTRLTAAGAGQPVDEHGFPKGAWTPETLTEALCQLDGNESGTNLRTVQHWFQNENRGIRYDNIRWLARIFGCNDPDATSEWQVILTKAQDRWAKKRRKNRTDPDTEIELVTIRSFSLPITAESMFRDGRALNLPIIIWAGLALLLLIAYLLGVHNITYSPLEGLEKQVGFLWSPAWTVGEPIFLPVVVLLVSQLLNYWVGQWRQTLDPTLDTSQNSAAWQKSVLSFHTSYWSIFIICFVLIFVVQWSGVYLFPLLNGATEVNMVDWITVGLKRPDAISITAAVVVSLLGFLYSGVLYWFYFVSFLLLYTVSNDFSRMCQNLSEDLTSEQQLNIQRIGRWILSTAYKCTVSGILIAATIKANATYLISDSENFLIWLYQDATYALGISNDAWDFIEGSPSPFITSFLLASVTTLVFCACVFEVLSAFGDRLQSTTQKADNLRVLLKMSLILFTLFTSFILIGEFHGFSLLLLASSIVSITSLFWKPRIKISNS